MAKKKTGEKPIDRTQIYVALIGVIGTVLVALITVLANRPAATSTDSASETNTAETSQTGTSSSQNGGLCLENYFDDIPAANRTDLTAGISTRILTNKDNLYGFRLFHNGVLLGELKIIGTNNTKSFQVVSVIDANCSQMFDYGNLDRPAADNALGDWENLGLNFVSGKYRLRMGWYSGNQIDLVFATQ